MFGGDVTVRTGVDSARDVELPSAHAFGVRRAARC